MRAASLKGIASFLHRRSILFIFSVSTRGRVIQNLSLNSHHGAGSSHLCAKRDPRRSRHLYFSPYCPGDIADSLLRTGWLD
ncbi:hypothetical protein F5Y03DRAFT_352867 [Xylaria venustula]|nr:hypothetical protein F5Y03DRAFT_352867 [Xylaria venustula]